MSSECVMGTRNPSDHSRELAAARLADKIGLMGSQLIVTNPFTPASGSPHELKCHQHNCRETFSTPCGCDTTASPAGCLAVPYQAQVIHICSLDKAEECPSTAILKVSPIVQRVVCFSPFKIFLDI